MTTPKFNATRAELDIIRDIAARAVPLATRAGYNFSRMDVMMDLECVHSTGNPLRLAELLAADDVNVAHDIFGIARHLNRQTGQLENAFSPRFSV